MTQKLSYPRYGGAFPTTASIAGALESSGHRAPHTGEAWSEAMLAGLAGGLAFGYFVFAYEGQDPQMNLITRNTFDAYGWDAVAPRIKLVQDVVQSSSIDKARAKLIEALEDGSAPIVWADVMTLGYEYSDLGPDMWMTQPIVVTAYDPDGEALIDDRAGVPIRVPAELLDSARARIKKERFRMVVVDLPTPPDLARELPDAIGQCVRLFTEKPPKGSANNFGFKAFDRWIGALTKPDGRDGWGKTFAPGRPLFAGLTSAFRYALQFWEDSSRTADRNLYAAFLEECESIDALNGAREVAELFRSSGASWKRLGDALLPATDPLLKEAREALILRHETFLGHGNSDMDKLQSADEKLAACAVRADDSLADPEKARNLMSDLAAAVADVRDAERAAIDALTELMA